MNLLVKPSSLRMLGTTPPPLGLLYMAAMDHSTVVWDGAILGDPYDVIHRERPEVVGVQMYTPGRQESLKLLEHAYNNGSVTVAGGPHVAPMSKQLEEYEFIDYLVSGDGELAWSDIINYHVRLSGKRPPRLIRKLVTDLDALPIPKWSLINIHNYPSNRINIVLGRGCDGQCVFCAAWWVNGKYRHHGADWMAEHLKVLGNLGVKHLVFQDDCLTNTEGAYNALIGALKKIPYRFQWTGTTRVDKIEKDQIRELRGLGCYSLGFGIESGSQTILDKINKQQSLERALEVREWCRLAGVRFKALMMTGFPFETPETRKEDAEFRKRLRPDEWGSVGHIIVLPGTRLYRDLKRQGVVDDSFWLGDEPYYKLGG